MIITGEKRFAILFTLFAPHISTKSPHKTKQMGKLVPRCFAANSDTLYFLARAVRTNDKTQQELVALVKSDPYPASIQAARWTVVSNSSSKYFSRWYYRYTMSGDLSCTVDDNGVFMFTGRTLTMLELAFATIRWRPRIRIMTRPPRTQRVNGSLFTRPGTLRCFIRGAPHRTMSLLSCSMPTEETTPTTRLRGSLKAVTAHSLWLNFSLMTRRHLRAYLGSSTRHSTAQESRIVSQPRIWSVTQAKAGS